MDSLNKRAFRQGRRQATMLDGRPKRADRILYVAAVVTAQAASDHLDRTHAAGTRRRYFVLFRCSADSFG